MAISSVPKPLAAETTAAPLFSVPWFSRVPASVLVPQLFLATGWFRASASHIASPGWWSGQEVTDFTEAHAHLAIVGYGFLIDSLVEPFSSAIAFMVLAAQLLVGISLILNWRPLAGLAVGAFLNLQFVLAGAVNPSIFYLVLALGIGSWHLDQVLTAQSRTRLAKQVLWGALLSTICLAPAATTVSPDRVVDDPAPVLIFLVVLGVIAARSLEFKAIPADRSHSEPAE